LTVKILLAIDDSRFSEAAGDAVIAQVKPDGTEIGLLHVLEPFPVALAEKIGSRDSADFADARLVLRNQAIELLTKTAGKFRSAGFKTSHFVEEGDAREVILNYADRWGADLIVVGCHGRKGLP
jgi:nucleotide-binding universal stress UspA family protein